MITIDIEQIKVLVGKDYVWTYNKLSNYFDSAADNFRTTLPSGEVIAVFSGGTVVFGDKYLSHKTYAESMNAGKELYDTLMKKRVWK